VKIEIKTTQYFTCLINLVFFYLILVTFVKASPEHQMIYTGNTNSWVKQNIKTPSYCELFRSMNYNEKIIRTVAIMYSPPSYSETFVGGNSDQYFYLKDCNNKDYFAIADFSDAKNLHLLNKVLTQVHGRKTPTLFSVVFTGRFFNALIPNYGHLGWLRAEFKVHNIESIKPLVSKYPLPDKDADASLLKIGSFLRFTNIEFMFSFFGRGFNKYELENILVKDTKIIIDENILSHKDFLDLSSDKKDGEVIVRICKVTKSSNVWRVIGSIEQLLENKVIKKLQYDNKFILQEDNSWKIIDSRLRAMQ